MGWILQIYLTIALADTQDSIDPKSHVTRRGGDEVHFLNAALRPNPMKQIRGLVLVILPYVINALCMPKTVIDGIASGPIDVTDERFAANTDTDSLQDLWNSPMSLPRAPANTCATGCCSEAARFLSVYSVSSSVRQARPPIAAGIISKFGPTGRRQAFLGRANSGTRPTLIL